MKGCSKNNLIGASLTRFVLTCTLLAFLAAPAVILYRESKPALRRSDLQEDDVQGNSINAEKLMSLRCDSILSGVLTIMLHRVSTEPRIWLYAVHLQ